MASQPTLPPLYRSLSAEMLDTRISEARQRLGDELVVLGHHYQRDEVIKHADFRGDSYKLSLQAASRSTARYIVFCGVYFMAESADILSGIEQSVILPNLTAGCSMADMASISDVEAAWDHLAELESSVVPVTYMNSSAELKAFCGAHGGIVCTSSNAATVMRWAFEHGSRVLFFPDEHLGRNTADLLGLDQTSIAVWEPGQATRSVGACEKAQLIVWKGFCSVHERFTVEQINAARRLHPDCHVVVHPECHRDVVLAADACGSTEHIVDEIDRAPSGAVIAVGTEINLVNRLAREHSDKTIFCLDPVVCPCSTMYRIHPAYLAWALDNLLVGHVVNRVAVPDETAVMARLALDRMIDVTGRSSGAAAASVVTAP